MLSDLTSSGVNSEQCAMVRSGAPPSGEVTGRAAAQYLGVMPHHFFPALVAALACTACGEPALAVLGEWRVQKLGYVIEAVDFDGNITDTQSFSAQDGGTMAFSAEPSGYGEYSFKRAMTKLVDRSGLQAQNRFVEVDEPAEVVVGFDPSTDDDKPARIFVYDPADEWNGDWEVSSGFGSVHLQKLVHTEFSPTQKQNEVFSLDLVTP